MVRIEYAVEIAAPPASVWRALCDPAEVVRWESGVVEALDAPSDYPRPGQRVHWRTTGSPPSVLLDQPQVVQRERVLRSLLSVGRTRMDETYTLSPAANGCRLSVTVEATSTVPMLGRLFERARLASSVRRDFVAALDSIKRHCESVPD